MGGGGALGRGGGLREDHGGGGGGIGGSGGVHLGAMIPIHFSWIKTLVSKKARRYVFEQRERIENEHGYNLIYVRVKRPLHIQGG
jgi:hypothetical protein